MGRFREQCNAFSARIKADTQAHFVTIAQEARRSIVEGSELTGAPGQPVDTGALKASWILDFPTKTRAEITTNLVYAPIIEDGMVAVGSHRGNATGNTQQRLTLRSAVGGFHSVALTVAGFQRIVDDVTSRPPLAPITAETGYSGEEGG